MTRLEVERQVEELGRRAIARAHTTVSADLSRRTDDAKRLEAQQEAVDELRREFSARLIEAVRDELDPIVEAAGR